MYQQDIAMCLSSEPQLECNNHSNGDNGGQQEGSQKAAVKRTQFGSFYLHLFIGVCPFFGVILGNKEDTEMFLFVNI